MIQIPPVFQQSLTAIQTFDTATETLNYLCHLYDESIQNIRTAFEDALNGGDWSLDPLACGYPYVGFEITQQQIHPDSSLSYGAVSEPGLYGNTVTRPDLFYPYYLEQLGLIAQNHKVRFIVGRSHWVIPLPFAVTHVPTDLDNDGLWHVKDKFVLPNLSRIHDDEANCTSPKDTPIKPLSLFSAERIDYSIDRLQHYTATTVKNFQSFILLTNYQRYIDAFIDFSLNEIDKQGDYVELVGPFDQGITRAQRDTPGSLPQMPAYHLKRKDGQGITFINIGVGPSNAKNITDHLAVLRPHCWLMVGHCAGLRSTQKLGDYVLAHAYVREDHVLDSDLPPWVPVPALAEIQVALEQAVANVTQEDVNEMKRNMRTGTVLTTGNRNWELRAKELYERFRQSRAIAVDMESATITANGFRFRVPYGTLLCVSDKPIHGEIKLQGIANTFYKQRSIQHLQIGLETIRLLREGGLKQLHSRKLRGFDDPPFR